MGRKKKIDTGITEVLTTDTNVELEGLNPDLSEMIVANAPTIKSKEIQTKFNIHDCVYIIGEGRGSYSGGYVVKPRRGFFYIHNIMNAAPYKYEVSDDAGNVLGYFKEEALERVK